MRFKYEEYILDVDIEDCSEENLSKIISKSDNKKILDRDEKVRIRILDLFEPTEIM